MSDRSVPYGAFNFLVSFEGSEAFGGFSDVSGLSVEITHAEYRDGNYGENHVRKVPGMHKVGDVTLKRGIIDSKSLWEWLDAIRKTGASAKKKSVVVKLLNEAREPVQSWTLRDVSPSKYTGPTLAAKGGGDVAMEELVLSVEGIAFNV